MDEESDRLESALQALSRSVRDLEARVDALEGERSENALPFGPGPDPARGLSPEDLGILPSFRMNFSTALSLAGGTFLALGGAFFLRAVTEAGAVPATTGVLVGLTYALVWIGLANRAASRGRSTAAEFHGMAAVLIAFPLLWEATTRFGALGPGSAGAALAIVTAIALGVAWHRRLPVVAWAFTLAATATVFALLFATGQTLLQTASLVALGVASLWIAYTRAWGGLPWFVAIPANFAVLRMTDFASRTGEVRGDDFTMSTTAALVLALSFLLAYLGSFAVRTLARRRDIGVFEVVQSAAALAVGLGGASSVAKATGSGGLALGLSALTVGGLCYAVAFVFVRRKVGRGPNFFFYTSLALVLVVMGCRLMGNEGVCTTTWGILAVGAAFLGGRFDRVTLRAHAAVYAIAVAVQSGLLMIVTDAWTGPVESTWRSAPWAIPALALTLSSYVTLVATRAHRTAPRLARAPRFVLASVSLLGVGGFAVLLLVSAIPGGVERAGAVAATRTAILSVAAAALAWTRRRADLPELGWLAGLALAATAVKLLAEDLRAGGAVPLFVAFAFYGLALMTASRLLWTTGRSERTPEDARTSGSDRTPAA